MHVLSLDMSRQPTDTTCGPTCMHAMYRYFDDPIALSQVVDEVEYIDGGGTLAPLLALHALRRGYATRIYTYNLQTFDPTWFRDGVDLVERMRARHHARSEPRMRRALDAYIEYVRHGGEVRFEDLSMGLLRRYLEAELPILTGLSSTYLYRVAREYGPQDLPDDVRGDPAGHFVVLHGFEPDSRTIAVADPWLPDPDRSHHYRLPAHRVVCAVLLGVLTHDANLLVIRPQAQPWPDPNP